MASSIISNVSRSNQASIEYQIQVSSTKEHLFEVTMKVDLSRAILHHCARVAMPAWIPGSYMIRDFSRNLHSLKSSQPSIVITQISKQEWEITSKNGDALNQFSLHYIIYANDLSVRSAFINDEYAFFNGTSVFLCLKGFEDSAHKIIIHEQQDTLLPAVVTSLPLSSAVSRMPESHYSFLASDYFELIDHPVLLGKFDDYSFDVMGHRFHLVFTGQHNFDFARMQRDLIAIIEHHIKLFGDFPCKEYWFITLVCEHGFGGLEHLASTVLQYSRFDLPLMGEVDKINKEYQQFLTLCSHELFHTWHVKRIKPEVMYKPNLFEEVYTPQLWIYEGFTSFYDDLSLARAKLISPAQYVQILNEALTRLMRNPGRLKQSASESSFDAWNKFYKQDAGSINHIVSYYNKGAIIALCLDITLRQQSNNKVSLDDVMKCLWERHGKTELGTPDDIILTLCKTEFDIDLSSFLYLATQTPIDLPIPTLLHSIGLKFKMRANHHSQDKGGPCDGDVKYDIGAVLAMQDKQLKVISIQENRSLNIAGLYVDDTIVAFNKWQCDDVRFGKLLNLSKLGDTLPIDVLRDGRLITLAFKVQPALVDTCDISIENTALFSQWLGIGDNIATTLLR
ncbi:MAG: putative metalloprotease with PDZ domain [Glaciecola sp.]|jgi:predicted metalloprotease with PDZ domain